MTKLEKLIDHCEGSFAAVAQTGDEIALELNLSFNELVEREKYFLKGMVYNYFYLGAITRSELDETIKLIGLICGHGGFRRSWRSAAK